jgi:predicted TIM-barrel fold metal-dependent hydrolase
MSASAAGPIRYRPGMPVIDADVHVAVPAISALYPYLPVHWRDYLVESGVRSLEVNTYPRGCDLAVRPEARPEEPGDPPGSTLEQLRRQLLDPWNVQAAIIHCDYGIHLLHNEDLAAAMARALNDWLADRWLSSEPRLYGSITVCADRPEPAIAEIERLAGRPEFVQVALPVRSPQPYGKRLYWPIYEAAARHDLAVAVYAGGGIGNPITAVGWPSLYLEDYVSFAQAFQAQLLSLVAEGVFIRYPALKVVFVESGFTWIPSAMWRLDKNWRGLRREVPWLDRRPSEIIRERLRVTLQPLDAPAEALDRVIEHLGGDEMLLFSTDYPHWQFDAPAEAWPLARDAASLERVLRGSAVATYGLDRKGRRAAAR